MPQTNAGRVVSQAIASCFRKQEHQTTDCEASSLVDVLGQRVRGSAAEGLARTRTPLAGASKPGSAAGSVQCASFVVLFICKHEAKLFQLKIKDNFLIMVH